jgi:UDP-glucose 6-dehydrogenase
MPPALDLVNWLIKAGAQVRAFDPVAMERARQVLPDHGIGHGLEGRNNDNKYLVGKPADGLVKHTASDGACIR